MNRIITLTMNPTIDRSTSVENVAAEQKLRCDAPRLEPGGGGVNVSRAIHRLGGESLAIYPAGPPIGDLLQELLAEEGIHQRTHSIAEPTRQNLMVKDETSGQQYRFNMPGPKLSREEWQKYLTMVGEDLERGDYVVASGSLPRGVPHDFYARLAVVVHEHDGRMALDTSEEELCLAAEEGVYLLKPNMRELAHLAGEEIESEEHAIEVAQDLVNKGKAQVVVVSLGAGGALWVSKDQMEYVRAPTVSIKSKIGAGDSMVAGIVLSLARGKTVRDAVLFGVAAGSAAVMTPGTELCRREDTERLYARMQER
jgi:6-phosphofructokinase 2